MKRVPWTARRANPSILKKINPESPLERLILKLKFQYFDHLMQRSDSLEKIHTMDISLSKLGEIVRDREA